MTDEARPSRENDAPRNREIVRHIAFALCGHVRRLRQEGQFVPSEVVELATFLSDTRLRPRRLGVSVHVERLARFRVSDLEAYVDGLDDGACTDVGSDS